MSDLERLKIDTFRAERRLRKARKAAEEGELVRARIKELAAREPQPVKWPGVHAVADPDNMKPNEPSKAEQIDGLERLLVSMGHWDDLPFDLADADAALEALALFEDIAEADGIERARGVLAAVAAHLESLSPKSGHRPAQERRDRRMLAMLDELQAAGAGNAPARVAALFSGQGPFGNGQDEKSIRRALTRARKKYRAQ